MDAYGKKVFVGLSGGVDSSVAAYLLKKEGYDVTGVFIKVWQPEFVDCTWQEDRLFAMRVAVHLDIPFRTLDLEEEYKKGVIDYMLSEYKAGRTPNPDVMCNKEVKFGAFLKWARGEGADYVATGHYARIETNSLQPTTYSLLRGKDEAKDQSYFLWTLTQDILKHTLFPIGHLRKNEVRKIAREAGLPTAEKKDSQGLCFISNVDMKEFLAHFMERKRGDVLDEKGDVIGYHDGAFFSTIGERHGFTVTEKSPDDAPYYVVTKDIVGNTLTVSHRRSPVRSKSKDIAIRETSFVAGDVPEVGRYTVQVRYHGEKIEGDLARGGDALRFVPSEPCIASPGQSLVLYDGDRALGGGIIS